MDARDVKIGVLGLTCGLYQKKMPELIGRLSSFRLELEKTLKNYADITGFGPISHKSELKQIFQKLEEENTAGLIIVLLSYSPSLLVLPFLKKFRRAVLIWNTQKLAKIERSFGPDELSDNHGMHGVQDLSSVLLRQDIPFSLITGHFQDKSTISKIEKWITACGTVSLLEKARIARIGGRFKDMGDFSVSDKSITRFLGPNIIEIPVEKVARESLKIKRREVEKVMKSDGKKFEVTSNLDRSTHFISSRMELALRRIVSREKLDGLGINFTAFKGKRGCEAIPFAAISKLMAEGLGYAGEGDVLCATSVLILQKLCGAGNFVEMFTTDYENNRILMSHMGESNLKMARDRRKIKLVKKEMTLIKPGLATAMFLFPLKPGDVTFFNIALAEDGRFRFIVTEGRILDKPLFKALNSPHFLLKVPGNIENFLTQYSLLGGTHHLAMTYGDRKEELRFFSEITDIPIFEI